MLIQGGAVAVAVAAAAPPSSSLGNPCGLAGDHAGMLPSDLSSLFCGCSCQPRVTPWPTA